VGFLSLSIRKCFGSSESRPLSMVMPNNGYLGDTEPKKPALVSFFRSGAELNL
jgi:hypothetical protein